MATKIVFYSRSGYSKAVAEKLASRLGAGLVELSDNKNWKGVFGFLKAGYYASSGKSVEITVHGTLADSDRILVVAPLWAGRVVPAVREFLRTRSSSVHYVVTSSGSTLKDRSGFASVTDIVRSANNEAAVLDNLVSSLGQ